MTCYAVAYRRVEYSAKQGDILELSEVWNRYCNLAEQVGSEVPHYFVSRRSSFKVMVYSMNDNYHVFSKIHKNFKKYVS